MRVSCVREIHFIGGGTFLPRRKGCITYLDSDFEGTR